MKKTHIRQQISKEFGKVVEPLGLPHSIERAF